jgi:hypothetical protein
VMVGSLGVPGMVGRVCKVDLLSSPPSVAEPDVRASYGLSGSTMVGMLATVFATDDRRLRWVDVVDVVRAGDSDGVEGASADSQSVERGKLAQERMR